MRAPSFEGNEDVILSLYVLQLMEETYRGHHFRMILVRHYPDLLDLIDTDELDHVNDELIAIVTDELNDLIMKSLVAIWEAKERMADVYRIDHDLYGGSVEFAKMSTAFYLRVVNDEFPDDDRNLSDPNHDWEHCWDLYHRSMVAMVCKLSKRFTHYKPGSAFLMIDLVELSLSWKDDANDDQNNIALHILQNLAKTLAQLYFIIYPILYPQL